MNILTLPSPPDWRNDFSLIKSVLWIEMLSICLLLIILLTWCFYFHLVRALSARKKLKYVECKDYTYYITRTEAKKNLRTVLESDMRTRPDNEVFDKVWYINRTETWIAEMLEERNKIWNDPPSDREIIPSSDEDDGN